MGVLGKRASVTVRRFNRVPLQRRQVITPL